MSTLETFILLLLAGGLAAGAIVVAARQRKALRRSDQILREAEELGQTGSWEQNLLTGEIFNSEENLRLFFGNDRGKGKDLEDYVRVIHPEDRDYVIRRRGELLTGGPGDIEYRVVWPDGSTHVLFGRATVVRDTTGKPLRVHGTNLDVTDRKRAEEALRQSADHLQHLSHRLLEVQEQERRHLARELHDEFGQLLAAVTLHLHAARGLAGERARSSLDECAGLLQRLGVEMRSLALELRPPLLETAGVDATLRWLAGKQQQATGAVVEVRGHLDEVPEELATALFRVAQEALTNVARHAQAKHVWIDLSQEENAVEMAIRDDGIGFDVASTVARAAADDRLGHLGMRERVDLLGGTLAVDSAPGRGTSIRISIPMPVAAVGPHRTDAGARG